MKFTLYLCLVLLVALALVPTAVTANGWVDGVCPQVTGELQNSGKVGSTATITIDAGSKQIGGPYEIRWSKKPIGAESQKGIDYIVVTEGRLPTETTKITLNFTVPESPYGVNYVQFLRGWRSDSPYGFSFNVLPTMSVSPSSGSPGSKVTIKGSGFPAKNDDIKLSFDDKDTKLSIITSDKGSFSAQFTIPDTIAGNHVFKARDENLSLGDVSASFQVRPKIILEPEQPEIGGEVTLSGCGFATSSQISIKYDDITITNSSSGKPLTTDANGSFSHMFKIPKSPRENHVITVTDKAGNAATLGTPGTPLELEGSAPPAPNPIYPCSGQRFGWFGPQTVTFKWQSVEDPSGVTYTINVGTNTSVWPPTVTREKLTGTTCTFRLEPGTYYWKVKAIDGAGNESEATLAPYPFKVGLFSIWFIAGLILFFFVVFILIIRAFFRRLREYYK